MVQLSPCYKADQPATLLPSFCNVHRLQYADFVLQVRNIANEATNRVCGTLLLDVVAHEMHQNDHSYVRELSGPTFGSLCKNLAWWVVTWKTSRKHKTVKIWGWALFWDNMVTVTRIEA